jgi:hypothetical protein
MNMVKEYQGHNEPIRGLSFSPTDDKLATGADDASIKVAGTDCDVCALIACADLGLCALRDRFYADRSRLGREVH